MLIKAETETKLRTSTLRGWLHLLLDVQFGCAFHYRISFWCHFLCQKLKNDIKNAFDSDTHIQTAHPKRNCNRPLKRHFLKKNYLLCILIAFDSFARNRILGHCGEQRAIYLLFAFHWKIKRETQLKKIIFYARHQLSDRGQFDLRLLKFNMSEWIIDWINWLADLNWLIILAILVVELFISKSTNLICQMKQISNFTSWRSQLESIY
jgi:hypothetical protein